MAQKDWTIMIYMAGDNNLSVDMAYALEQIKGVVGEGDTAPNLFVYYDGNSPEIPTLYCDFSEPGRPRYFPSHKVLEKLYPVPAKINENAAAKKSLLNFIDWCVNKVEVASDGKVTKGRRARKYSMIFSGHSLGFQDIGLFKDESSGKSMSMVDLYFALQRATGTEEELEREIKGWELKGEERDRETTVLIGKKFDILGFDSCVMGMLEVGYQFGTVAKTMIASEGSVPNAGWTYAKLLGSLARGSGKGGHIKVAEHFVREFIKTQDSFTVGGVSVDMAAWDLEKLTDLASVFDELSGALIRCFDDRESRIYRQMARVILHVHWRCQSYMYDQNVDLGDFCELLAAECSSLIEELAGGEDTAILEEVRDRCKDVLTQLRRSVILSGFSGGTYQYSNGISVFFPWSREGYAVSKENYEGMWFSKEAGSPKFFWTGFLKKYLNEVALRRFEPLTPDATPGSKYRYESGLRFDDGSYLGINRSGNGITKLAGLEGTKLAGVEGTKLAGVEGTKLAGIEGTKLAGVEGTKLAGVEGTKLAGVEGTKLAGVEGTKLAGVEGTKLAGVEGTKLAGVEGTKLAGVEGTKLAGVEGTKLAGVEGTKLAGVEGTKLAGVEGTNLVGVEGTKLAGVEGTKLAGVEGTKLAGVEGTKLSGSKRTKLAGGDSNAFFENLRLFKNVESRWNISGFTKKADEGRGLSEADNE